MKKKIFFLKVSEKNNENRLFENWTSEKNDDDDDENE